MYSIWGTSSIVLNKIALSFFGKITFAVVSAKVLCEPNYETVNEEVWSEFKSLSSIIMKLAMNMVIDIYYGYGGP